MQFNIDVTVIDEGWMEGRVERAARLWNAALQLRRETVEMLLIVFRVPYQIRVLLQKIT